MSVVLAWILVTANGYGVTTYSPPLADLETCQHLFKELPKIVSAKCVQLRIVK